MLQLRPSTDWASLVAQLVNNLPAKQETWVQIVGGEDSPGGGHSIFLPGESLGTEEPGRLQSMGLQSVGQD